MQQFYVIRHRFLGTFPFSGSGLLTAFPHTAERHFVFGITFSASPVIFCYHHRPSVTHAEDVYRHVCLATCRYWQT